MRVKIIGIGKCGVRIAYDFFAYTRGFPLSYEIRLQEKQGPLSLSLEKFGIRPVVVEQRIVRFKAAYRALINDINGFYRIAENPLYATIESDIDNNEVVNSAIFSAEDGQQAIFAGENYRLNDHKGGCNFHIVSEGLARAWESIPDEITDTTDVSIYVASFSIGGGTGGGSAPAICLHSTQAMENKNACHHMGVGILPKSDEHYLETESMLSMADYEKFNTGRFFASIYADRFRTGMRSLWLFSNDAMRFLITEQTEKNALADVGGEQNLNLSLVNAFIAQSLTVMSNSSSRLTRAETNMDPRELNDILNGRPFISALSQRRVENAETLGHQVPAVKQLLSDALSNIKDREGRLEGLSVPVRDAVLQDIHEILDNNLADHDEFIKALGDYSTDSSPIEFQTTERLVIIYGQPEKLHSPQKEKMIMDACDKFIPNAQKYLFTFRHHASTEILLLFLVDPFIRPVVSSMYYYANNAWGRSGKNLNDEFDTLIEAAKFHEPKFLDKAEGFPELIYGGGTEDIMERAKNDPSLVIDRQGIVDAFRHLHKIYHRERPSMNTSSKLG